MIFRFKHNFSLLVIFLCVAGFSGCASNDNQANAAKNATTNASATTQTNAQSGGKAPARVEIKDGDKIGIAECDEYLAKYEACANKVPEPGRGAMLSSIKQLKNSWITIAVNPETRTNLAAECRKNQEETKQNLSAYSCAW
jgi:hypothetical protein